MYLLAELLPVPRLHARVSESDDGGNLRFEGRNLVLDDVADVALGHLPGVVEDPRGFLDGRPKPLATQTVSWDGTRKLADAKQVLM